MASMVPGCLQAAASWDGWRMASEKGKAAKRSDQPGGRQAWQIQHAGGRARRPGEGLRQGVHRALIQSKSPSLMLLLRPPHLCSLCFCRDLRAPPPSTSSATRTGRPSAAADGGRRTRPHRGAAHRAAAAAGPRGSRRTRPRPSAGRRAAAHRAARSACRRLQRETIRCVSACRARARICAGPTHNGWAAAGRGRTARDRRTSGGHYSASRLRGGRGGRDRESAGYRVQTASRRRPPLTRTRLVRALGAVACA